MKFTKLPYPFRETRVSKLVFIMILCLKFWVQGCNLFDNEFFCQDVAVLQLRKLELDFISELKNMFYKLNRFIVCLP